ncbi:alpha/beta hydrolase [Cytobacillus praedii]|uniref:alpha/beta hydrolase n=1 Tax=Cytobacillus praedii TaxID=1742358 RepID=UPI00070B1215|nr:alpha/beta hydrolase [Cytobacillus praedii]
MKKTSICILMVLCVGILFLPPLAHAEAENETSIIVATGKDVPTDDHLPEGYRFPEKYRDKAVQFRTEDGVLLSGYVLGEGNQGITLGHANGWMVSSWLPFGERLVDEGYMVMIWEFRNILPSGSSPQSESQRWDLDVLAAAQVLRERGATEILGMGASDGGNATAVAAPHIPDLVGLALLSSPKNSRGNALEAVAKIDVPAFFAVSSDDPVGNFYDEVKPLYDASVSEQKEFHLLTSYEHGTDLLSDVDRYSAKVGSTEEQKQERRQLADDLMRFVNETFDKNAGETETQTSTPKPDEGKTDAQTSTPKTEGIINRTENTNDSTMMYPLMIIGLGVLFLLIVFVGIKYKKK